MSERITLELPDTLAQAAREEAERTGQSVEIVLLSWIKKPEDRFLIDLLGENRVYPIYTPFGNEEAAAQLLKFIEENDSAKTSDEENQ
jgi:hypothetical protein